MAKLDPNAFTPRDHAVDDETLAIILAILALLEKPVNPQFAEKQILLGRQAVEDYRQEKN